MPRLPRLKAGDPPDLPGLNVTLRKLADLRINGRNARRHTPDQIERIKGSIQAFGFVAPIIIGTGDEVLAGEARLKAAQAAGLTEAPTISLAHLNGEAQRAYMLADNRLAELASWDERALAMELQDLSSLDLDFSLASIGFDAVDLDRLFGDLAESPVEESAPPPLQEKAVTRLGDVWLLGDHRLICGDAREAAVYDALMADETARVVLTDPPFNVPVAGHITKRDTLAREFPMASGEMTPAEFTTFLTEALGAAARHAMDGSIHYVFMDWRHIKEVVTAGDEAIGPLTNLIVWAKPNAGMGAFYRSQHELVFVFKKGKAAHVNTFGLGENGRYRTNVWTYPGASGFHADRDGDLAMHVTPKPVAMLADAMLDVSHRGEIVLDIFGGSGSTLMAADQTGRRARLIELDPLYCDVICRRFLATGGMVTREADGMAFEAAARQPLLLEGPHHV